MADILVNIGDEVALVIELVHLIGSIRAGREEQNPEQACG